MTRLFEKPFFITALLALLTIVPSIFMLPITDRDEARFVQASKQMMDTGNYKQIMNQDTPRLKKPYGIYWMQVAAVKITGAKLDQAWGYRIPSALAGILSVLFFAYFTGQLFGQNVGTMGSLLLLSTVLLQVESTLGKTDMVLFFFSTLALGSLLIYLFDTHASKYWIYGFWIALGMTIFIKGPVIPTFFILGGLAYKVFKSKLIGNTPRPHKSLAFPLGILILCLMNAPWIYLLQATSQGQFLQDSIGQDLLQKLFKGMESHGAYPGFYVLTIFISFLPGSLFLIPAVQNLWRAKKDAASLFLICFIVPGWVLLELVPTKLPHYTFPFFPVLAIFIARYLVEKEISPFTNAALKIFRVATLVLAPICFATLAYFFGAEFNWPLFLYIAAFVIACGTLLWLFPPTQTPIQGLLLTAIIVLVAVKYTLAAHMPDFWITQKIQKTLGPKEKQIIAVGYPELSLAFYLGTNTKFTDTQTALKESQNAEGKKAILIEHSQLPKVMPTTLIPLATFRGFHYSKGRWRTYTLYETH